MSKQKTSNLMVKILSKILIIIIALFILIVISIGLNIYFVYELSNYETVVTYEYEYENTWKTEKYSDDQIQIVNGNQYNDTSTHIQ